MPNDQPTPAFGPSPDAAIAASARADGFRLGRIAGAEHADERAHAAYKRGKAEGAAELARVQALLDIAQQRSIMVLKNAKDAYERGLREATEGWGHEWAFEHRYGWTQYDTERDARNAAAVQGRTVVSRLVGPWEPAAQPKPCPRIAHESGVVLACTVDHGDPRSGLHANVHHQVMWGEDDDRIIAEPARGGTVATEPDTHAEGGAR